MENDPSPLMKPDIQLSTKVQSLRSILESYYLIPSFTPCISQPAFAAGYTPYLFHYTRALAFYAVLYPLAVKLNCLNSSFVLSIDVIAF